MPSIINEVKPGWYIYRFSGGGRIFIWDSKFETRFIGSSSYPSGTFKVWMDMGIISEDSSIPCDIEITQDMIDLTKKYLAL